MNFVDDGKENNYNTINNTHEQENHKLKMLNEQLLHEISVMKKRNSQRVINYNNNSVKRRHQ